MKFDLLTDTISAWLNDQATLFQAFFVALSLHVVLFPIMWIIGWALPWPKFPIVTTIIEYDLRGWPNMPKPKKVINVMDPDLNK
ncbi:hypothetical protein BH11CYA1_BH11CYA1_02830 [soil metagenome]